MKYQIIDPFVGDDSEAAIDRAENISYHRLDGSPRAYSMPDTIGMGYHDEEYDRLADEQPHLHAGIGEARARQHTVDARRTKVQHDADLKAVETQEHVLDAARADLDEGNKALKGLTRREPKAKFIYFLVWTLLLGGDVAGVTGAAVLLGEIPWLAAMQAVSIAIAAVTSGVIGADVKDARLARRRVQRSTRAGHEKFEWLLNGPDAGETVVKWVAWIAISTVLFVFVGIFTLRVGVEGPLAGAAFGAMSLAICTGSFLNRYSYTDEVADQLDLFKRDYNRELKQYQKLAKSKAIAHHAAETASAESVKAEHAHLGKAAYHHFKALKQGIYRINPAVFGHGPALSRRQVVPSVHNGMLAALERDFSSEQPDGLTP